MEAVMKEAFQERMQEAINDLKIAEQNFDYAAPEYVDSAILNLDCAKRRVDRIRRICTYAEEIN